MGVIFPFVSVQEIICTGMSTQSMLSIDSTSFLANRSFKHQKMGVELS